MFYEHIGFTGTQRGMTVEQATCLTQLWRPLKSRLVVLHHGDCIGGDEQADKIGRLCGFRMAIHPTSIEGKRAFCSVTLDDELFDPRPPLERNQVIVDAVEALYATPAQYHPVPRSGTWSTINRAVKARVSVTVILPNGELKDMAALPARRHSGS